MERHKYSLVELENTPTISSSQFDDLKMDDGETRIWLSRMGVEDGAPYENQVTVEELHDGRWIIVGKYQAPSRLRAEPMYPKDASTA